MGVRECGSEGGSAGARQLSKSISNAHKSKIQCCPCQTPSLPVRMARTNTHSAAESRSSLAIAVATGAAAAAGLCGTVKMLNNVQDQSLQVQLPASAGSAPGPTQSRT